MLDEPASPYAIPTHEGISFNKNSDGGWTISISVKATTLARLRAERLDDLRHVTLEALALLLDPPDSQVDPLTGHSKAS